MKDELLQTALDLSYDSMNPELQEDFRIAHRLAEDLRAGKYKARARRVLERQERRVVAFTLPKDLAVDLYAVIMQIECVTMTGAVQAGIRMWLDELE